MPTAIVEREPASTARVTEPRIGVVDPYQPHRTRLLTAEQVRAFSVLRPRRAIVDVAWCWGCILAAWTLVAWHPAWWTVLLAIPVIGNRFYALFIIGHDGMHRRVLNDHTRNDLFCDLLIYGSIGAITSINNRNHLAHHRHLGAPEDPDRHKHACFSKPDRGALVAYVLGLSALVPTVLNVFGGRHSKDEVTRTPYSRRDVAILLAWPAVLITALTLAIGWWAYPVLWLLPVYALAFTADNLRSFAEHSHPERDDKADHHRLITYLPNPLDRVLFAPMNMNYHAVHHLWPSIPYYNLPEADWVVRGHPERGDLEWRRSYFGYLRRYWRALPLEECRRDSPTPEMAGPHIATEPVERCPVCTAASFEPYATGRDYELGTCANAWNFVRCTGCRHVWLNPRPAIETLPVIYPPHYYAYDYEERINPIAVWGKAMLDRLKLRTILRRMPRPPRTYLDIGCGTGRYLQAMHARGLDKSKLHGLELDKDVVTRLAEDGFQVSAERVESCTSVAPGSMDLVTMFHVIEHVDDPRAVVSVVAEWLAPGGIFAIETPNLESWDARLFRRRFWGGYHVPRHWNLFTPGTLDHLLTGAGFEIVGLSFQTGHSFWMYSLHHALKYGRSPRPRLARLFDPFRSLPLLVAFTVFDRIRAMLGFRTSAMLMLARRR